MEKQKLLTKTVLMSALFLFAAGISVCAKKTAHAIYYFGSSVIELDADAGLTETGSYPTGSLYTATATEADGKYYMQVFNDDDDYFWGYYDFDKKEFVQTAAISYSDEMRDITYDAATKTIYGTKSSQIYKVDMATGKTEKFYSQGGAMFCGFTSDGKGGFYGYSSIGTKLYHYSGAPAADNFTETALTLPDGYSSVDAYSSLAVDAEGGLYMAMKCKNPAGGYSQTSVLCKIDPSTGTITAVGQPLTSATAVTGLSFASFNGGTVNPPTDPDVISKVKYEYTYGDAMGEGSGVTKYTEYFYGPDNSLLRSLQYSIDLQDKSEVPYQYTKYVTTTGDDGSRTVTQSMRKNVAGGGSLSDLDRYWQDYTEIDVTTYDASGKMVQYTKTGNTRKDYTYEGENLVSEEELYVTGGSLSGKIKSKVYYSDFVEGLVNCPQKALVGARSATSVTMQEYKYDDAGRKTECITYKTTDALSDDDGVFYEGAVKGDPKQKETWTYDAEGRLTEYVTLKKYKDGEWAGDYNNKKKTYEYDGDATTIRSFSGKGTSVNEWSQSTVYTKEVTAEFTGSSALSNLTVTQKENTPGTYVLTADAPAVAVGDKAYKVYRDGVVVGEMAANAETGKMTYEEKVGNGLHDWFVQTYDNTADVSMNISNAVELEVSTVLNPVSVINVTRNEPEDGRCHITVEWEAPVTEGAEILGYNFYTDVVNLDNATPVNTELITETSYSYSWDNTAFTEADYTREYYIEAVYDLGKVKSEKQTVTLSHETSGISEARTGTPDVRISGNTVSVDGSCDSICVSSIGGSRVAETAGSNTVSLAGLTPGVYLVTIKAGDASQTVKVVKR